MSAAPLVTGRVVAISPHLDDAVFGCGDFLGRHPGCAVATVFAGTPPPSQALSPWDAGCGFSSAQQAMQARRREDAQALGILQARPIWLPLLDDQYRQDAGEGRRGEDIAAALKAAIDEEDPQTVLIPMGLFHSDHVRVHRAALACMTGSPARRWLAYEDALYRRMEGLLQQRLAALHADGYRATPWPAPAAGASRAKRAALRCYASQLRAFGPGGYADCRGAERLWQLRGPKDEHVPA